MKKHLSAAIFFFGALFYGQVGIGTVNPQGTLHIDGAKDNPTVGLPSAAQSTNDVIVSNTGNVSIGTATTTNSKVEINSSVAGNGGLRFSQLNSTSTVTTGTSATLGVNTTGDVVVVTQNTANGSSCMPDYGFATGPSNNFTTNSGSNITTLTNVVVGGITHNAGIYTLRAGNTYRLEAAFYVTGSGTSAALIYRWYDVAANTPLPAQNTPRSTAATNTQDGSQPVGVAIFRPTVDTQVVLRMESSNTQYWGQHSYIFIQQLNPCK